MGRGGLKVEASDHILLECSVLLDQFWGIIENLTMSIICLQGIVKLTSWDHLIERGSVSNRTTAWSPSQVALQLKSSLSFILWMQSLPSGVHLIYSFGSLPTDACTSAGTHLHFSRILLVLHSWNNSTLQPLCLKGMLRKALVDVILFTAVIL